MKKFFYTTIILPLLLTSTMAFAAKKGVTISVELTPAGSFEITGKVKGKVTKKGDTYVAKKLTFSIPKLKTGLDLRDKHTKDYMSNKGKHKTIVVAAKGKGGKGVGTIKVRGKKKKFKFTYEEKGKKLHAKFALNIKDFGITGVSYMGVGVDDKVEVTAVVGIKK